MVFFIFIYIFTHNVFPDKYTCINIVINFVEEYMKKTLSIVFVYIGLVIGAGFASGREILEYFNNSNQSDFTGIILAALLFAAISFIVMHHSSRLGAKDFDTFIDCTAGPLAQSVKFFMLTYMFCGLFVMMAGSGALFTHAFGVPSKFGIFALALFCFIVFSFDLKGLVAVNSFMVPFMVLGIIILCITSALSDTAPVFAFSGNIRRNSIVSSICYASYNTITAGAVLIPLAYKSDTKTILRSAAVSSFVLGFLIFTVWLVQNIYYNNIASSEMPLFDLASMQGDVWKTVYAIVLFMSLCTTAISHGFGILSKFRLKSFSDRILASAALCTCALPFAKIGFSDLVAHLYSAFGFLGLIWLTILLFSYFSHKKG